MSCQSRILMASALLLFAPSQTFAAELDPQCDEAFSNFVQMQHPWSPGQVMYTVNMAELQCGVGQLLMHPDLSHVVIKEKNGYLAQTLRCELSGNEVFMVLERYHHAVWASYPVDHFGVRLTKEEQDELRDQIGAQL